MYYYKSARVGLDDNSVVVFICQWTCLSVAKMVLVYSARRYGVRLVVYVQFSSVGVGTVWGVAALLFILGSNLGGVGPDRGLRGGGRRGWYEE